MKKSMIFVLAMLLVLSVGAVNAGAVELRVYSMFSGADPASGVYEELIEEFKAEHPEVKIIDESATLDESVKVRIENDFASGNEPDITMYFTDSQAKPIVESGRVTPLNDILANNPDWKAGFLPSVLEQVRYSDGNIYALPITGFYEGLIVNLDLFEKYDVKIPETREDLFNAVETFRTNDIVPMAAGLGMTPHYNIEHSILKVGGAAAHDAGIADGINPMWIEGLNHMKELYDADAFQKDTLTQDWSGARQLFKQGKAAMLVEGSWAIADAQNEGANRVTIVPYPKVGENGNQTDLIAGFTSGMYLSKEAYNNEKKQDVVVELLKHLTNKEAIKKIAEANGGLPAADVTPAGLSKPYQDGLEMFKNADHVSLPIDAQIQRPAWQTLVDGVAYIVSGRRSAENILEEVRKIELQTK
ncbi:ABC transporter substrate-binding protein [Halanaerobium kushneri]|uniref:Carbohydrate ABC transporter substrate-binding protein, CUT1 family n=1 Tax=Halanaerobium kushneri TaxID=56779 RepID=A0A1N7B186_9FIRM|nr:extracellular solute-binding protein [Halanaerobium kushneri]SIR45018.1 carbohydrate ABC transporter substrate-binding protein, CUT1 family [Halanaerobium kushneri]